MTMALPHSLIDIAETLGLPLALRLMAAFGGQELRIPKEPVPGHPILKALGETDGRALCQYLADEKIYVPHGRPARNARAAVLELERKGRSRREIARLLGLSQRHVRRMANRGDPDQPDLFDLS